MKLRTETQVAQHANAADAANYQEPVKPYRTGRLMLSRLRITD